MPRKFNPKSLENLKPFEKGHKPAGGRPKGSVSLVTVIERMLTQKIELPDPLSKKRLTKEVRDWIVTSLLTKAMKGDISAIKEILERIDGKVTQKTEDVTPKHEDALDWFDGDNKE
jgi:hypothetical protein